VKVTIEIEHALLWLLALLLRKKPKPPTHVTATTHIGANGMSNVTVAWTPPTLKPGQSSLKAFRVYAQAQGAPSPGLIGQTQDATETSMVDENVAVGTWSYFVTTVDSKNRESPMSSPPAVVTVTVEPDSVPPDPPTNVTAVIG
jgi:fibronectin type 3 domain-containing protein